MAKQEIENLYTLVDLRRDVKIASGGKYSQENIENILRLAFDVITTKLGTEGVPVYLIDFMNFTPKDFEAKPSKHPQTGEDMVIEPYRTVYMKPSKKFKNKLTDAMK